MKKQILLTTVIALFSTALLASGSHSGGHEEKKHSGHNMANMDAHWASPKSASKQANPITADTQSIAKGSAIYQKNCASCHGKTARGDGPTAAFLTPKPTDLKAMAGGHPDGDFAWKIANGRGPMPAWKGILNKEDIWHTVNYIQSLKDNKASHDDHNSGQSHGHK